MQFWHFTAMHTVEWINYFSRCKTISVRQSIFVPRRLSHLVTFTSPLLPLLPSLWMGGALIYWRMGTQPLHTKRDEEKILCGSKKMPHHLGCNDRCAPVLILFKIYSASCLLSQCIKKKQLMSWQINVINCAWMFIKWSADVLEKTGITHSFSDRWQIWFNKMSDRIFRTDVYEKTCKEKVSLKKK